MNRAASNIEGRGITDKNYKRNIPKYRDNFLTTK